MQRVDHGIKSIPNGGVAAFEKFIEIAFHGHQVSQGGKKQQHRAKLVPSNASPGTATQILQKTCN